MKKYRLIKKYPGSPNLGEIRIGSKENERFYPSQKCMENNPEFWEEVVEKDYEILSFTHPRNGCLIKKWGNNLFGSFDGQYNAEELLADPNLISDVKLPYNIHSIKRLSDGEIFTVGDVLDFNGIGIGKLIRIDFERAPVDKNTGKLCFVNDNVSLGDWWSIDQLSKVKKPLFTTKDGVEIFEGDEIHILYLDTFQIRSYKKGWLKFWRPNKIELVFSTKAAAEEYILMNKPCLSINDLYKVYTITNYGKYQLKQFVKHKLKL